MVTCNRSRSSNAATADNPDPFLSQSAPKTGGNEISHHRTIPHRLPLCMRCLRVCVNLLLIRFTRHTNKCILPNGCTGKGNVRFFFVTQMPDPSILLPHLVYFFTPAELADEQLPLPAVAEELFWQFLRVVSSSSIVFCNDLLLFCAAGTVHEGLLFLIFLREMRSK